jgi:hypothetical protein
VICRDCRRRGAKEGDERPIAPGQYWIRETDKKVFEVVEVCYDIECPEARLKLCNVDAAECVEIQEIVEKNEWRPEKRKWNMLNDSDYVFE